MTERGRVSKTTGYYLAFVMLGLSRAVVGPTLPALAAQTNASLSAIGILFTVAGLGALLGSVVGGWLYDRTPGHPILTAMLGIVVLIFFVIPLTPTLWGLIGLFWVLGIVQNMLDLGSNTFLVWVHREKVGPFMNALHFFFGGGAFLAPLIVGWALKENHNVTIAYWIIAIFMVPVAIGFLFLPSPALYASTTTTDKGKNNPLLVGGIALFFFLYCGSEVGFGGWIYTYAVTSNLATPARAASLTSVFWGALTLGRLLAIPLAARLKPVTFLAGSLTGCVLNLTIILIFSHVTPLLWTGVAGLGISMAAVFPTTLSFTERRMALTGQVTGIFFVGRSLGSMSIPWLIGQILDRSTPQSMIVVLLSAMVASITVLAGIYAVARVQQTPL